MGRLPQQLHHVEQRSTGIQLTERKNDGKKKLSVDVILNPVNYIQFGPSTVYNCIHLVMLFSYLNVIPLID